jgi:hypothetical protein
MAGRVLRLFNQEPIKQIVQCKRTPHPFIKTAFAHEQYVWSDDGWQSLALNQHIEQITHNMRGVLAQLRVELPKLVTLHRAAQMPWQQRVARTL